MECLEEDIYLNFYYWKFLVLSIGPRDWQWNFFQKQIPICLSDKIYNFPKFVPLQVSVELEHLGLVAVGQPAEFTIRVPEGADAELAVSVQGPVEDIPVKVTGELEQRFRMSSLLFCRFSSFENREGL